MKKSYQKLNTGIKFWAEEDRPREKLLLKGKLSLSDAELLAILIGSGSREETAVSLSQKILQSQENSLHQLGKSSVSDLQQFKGIGEAKAISIVAAMELGRRRQLSPIKDKPQIRSSKDAYQVLAPIISDLPHEEFWILLLNRANKVIGRERVSIGGVAGTVVDAKIIFRKALSSLACGIILCHNHPSGSLHPSQADLDITQKLKKAGQNLEINVLDHLIISEMGYFSFADEGKL